MTNKDIYFDLQRFDDFTYLAGEQTSTTVTKTTKAGTTSGTYNLSVYSGTHTVTATNYKTVDDDILALKPDSSTSISVTNESCTVKVSLNYGLTSGTYSTLAASETHTITLDNYADHLLELEAIGAVLEAEISNTAVFKLFNIELPDDVTETYTTTSTYQASNTYILKTTYTQGPTTDSSNTIYCTTNWGVKYECTGMSSTHVFTTSNYSDAQSILAEAGASQRNSIKTNIISKVRDAALLHFDSSATTDAAGGTWVTSGTSLVSSSGGAKFSKGLKIPLGGYIENTSYFYHRNADFCIDFFLHLETGSDENARILVFEKINKPDCKFEIIRSGTRVILQAQTSESNIVNYTATSSTWVYANGTTTTLHIALACTAAGTFKLYRGGTSRASIKLDMPDGIYKLRIGSSFDGTNRMQGTIDCLRVAMGYIRWTTTFTPPSQVTCITLNRNLRLPGSSASAGSAYEAANGITYHYRMLYYNVASKENRARYIIKWGLEGAITNTYIDAYIDYPTDTYYTAATRTELIKTVNAKVTELKAFLDTLISDIPIPDPITVSYGADNGITYYLQTTYSKSSEGDNTATSCDVVATTVWGTDTNYGQTYSTVTTTTVTAANYSSYSVNDVSTAGTAQNEACKNFLDTLIGPVTAPSESTTTYTTNSTKTFYVKTTYTGGNSAIDATACTITYTTVYGLTNSYGNTLSSNKTLNITASNLSTWTSELASNTGIEQNKVKDLESYKLLNLTVPTGSSKTHTATNGNTYQYKWTYSQGNADLTSNTYLLSVTWGLNNYSQTYETQTIVFTASTDTTSYSDTNIKNYLNTLIGTITAPSDSLKTLSTNSGKSFYIKTTYSGGNTSVTATSCTISTTTVYGLTNSYGNQCSTNSLPISISNLSSWTSELASLTTIEQNKVKDLASYKMLDVALPNAYSDTYTANNTKTYNVKTAYSQGEADLTSNTIVLTSSYNNTTYETNTVVLNTSTYTSASTLINTETGNQQTRLQNYLDTYLKVPTAYTKVYTKNGFNFNISLIYSLTSDDSKNLNETAYIDGLIYNAGSGLVGTYSTQSALDSALTSRTSEIVSNIESVISTYCYPDLSEIYTKGGMSFKLDAKYTKAANDTVIKLNKYIDGAQFENTLNVFTISTNFDTGITSFTNQDSVNGMDYMKLLLGESLPIDKSETYIVRDSVEFPVQLTYTKAVGYSSPITIKSKIHGTDYTTKEIKYLNHNELEKIGQVGDYVYQSTLADIKNSIPNDSSYTLNSVNVKKTYTKSSDTKIVTCQLYLDNQLNKTETATYNNPSEMYDILNALCEVTIEQQQQAIEELDLAPVNLPTKQIISPSPTVQTSHTISVKIEKNGNKVRVYRLIDRLKTNYIDVTVNYNDIDATNAAIQEAAQRLIDSIPANMNFKRPGGLQAAQYLLKARYIA